MQSDEERKKGGTLYIEASGLAFQQHSKPLMMIAIIIVVVKPTKMTMPTGITK